MNGSPGQSLAMTGALWGLAGAVLLSFLRFVLGNDPAPTTYLPDIAFGVLYIGPFLLPLAMLPVRNSRARWPVWLGCGFLGVLASFTAFSGVSLIMLPGAVLLITGAVREARASDRADLPTRAIALLLSVGIVLVGVASFAVFVTSGERVCWQAFDQGGERVWEMRRLQPGEAMSISSPGGYCTSGYVSPTNALKSLGIWLAGASAVVILGLQLDKRDGLRSPLLLSSADREG